MSNLNLQKLREWVWPWPWTFKRQQSILDSRVCCFSVNHAIHCCKRPNYDFCIL